MVTFPFHQIFPDVFTVTGRTDESAPGKEVKRPVRQDQEALGVFDLRGGGLEQQHLVDCNT